MACYFVTGTDTDIGKTVASVLLIETLNKRHKSTLGIKPISAGCENTSEGLRNDDALALQRASSVQADYHLINPIAYEAAIAPHIAASEKGETIQLAELQACLDKALNLQADYLFVEGAGGWRLPLGNNGVYLSDFAMQNQMNVILVVGMKLGCLNHAMLSHQAIERDGLNCVGWIANQLSSDMPYYQENLASLKALLPSPLLAEIPYQQASISHIHLSEHFLQVFT